MGPDILASTLVCLGSRRVSAKELVVFSSAGARSVMDELGPEFERGSGIRAIFSYDSASALGKSIEAGARFDVAVLTPRVISALVARGKISDKGRWTLANVGIGVATKRGATKPDVSAPDKLVAALRAASVIAFPAEGASGDHFRRVVKDLNLSDSLKGKMRPILPV